MIQINYDIDKLKKVKKNCFKFLNTCKKDITEDNREKLINEIVTETFRFLINIKQIKINE